MQPACFYQAHHMKNVCSGYDIYLCSYIYTNVLLCMRQQYKIHSTWQHTNYKSAGGGGGRKIVLTDRG